MPDPQRTLHTSPQRWDLMGTFDKLLMYIKNNNGPITYSCGTPHLIPLEIEDAPLYVQIVK